MKNLIKFTFAWVLLGAVLTGCDETPVFDEQGENPPVIESFTPQSAPIGSEIVIEGQHLNNVTVASIGGVEVPIVERVSSSRISIRATTEGRTGKIKVTNRYGSSESSSDFTYTYVVPSIIASVLPSDVVMSTNLLISGESFGVVDAVLFTSPGHSAHPATIISRTETEFVVRVPYVEDNTAAITLRYFNGTSMVETDLSTAPAIGITRYVPSVSTTQYDRTAVGRSMTLTGTYMDMIDEVKIGGAVASISEKTATTITFTVPAGEFVDGDNTTDITIYYFDGNEQQVLLNDFVVFVPFVRFWENIQVWGQGRDVENFISFFSPETGRRYANADWRTLDAVSYANQALNCTEANRPNKDRQTEADYNSVVPYFFFSGVSAGHLQINSPANSASQLRNFYMQPGSTAVDNRVTGSSGDCWGTPVFTFRYLDPGNAAELAIINKVKDQTLDKIDEEEFPIDVTAKTIAGIGISSAAGSLNSQTWAPGYTPGTDALNLNVDAVIMFMYYNINGPKAEEGIAANIKRIGFIHIKTVNFRRFNNTAAPSSSDVLFNCYLQKYDYDYSKL